MSAMYVMCVMCVMYAMFVMYVNLKEVGRESYLFCHFKVQFSYRLEKQIQFQILLQEPLQYFATQ